MEGIINIKGDIGTDVKLVDVISQVKKQPDASSFKVIINSAGGYVEDGFQIYRYIKSLGIPIHTIGENIVASIATIIFLAGEKRSIYDNTKFHIHLPSLTVISGVNSEQLDYASKELKKIEADMIAVYNKATSIESEQLSTLMRNETDLTKEQLFNFGFITDNSELKIAAKLIINKTKEEMTEEQKKEGKSILDELKSIIKGFKKDDVVALKELYTADEKKLEFPDLNEEDNLRVGINVLIDGSAAENGNYTLKDGRTLVVVDGKVSEIKEEKEEDEEASAKFKAQLDVLSNEIKGIKEDNANLIKLNETLKEANAKMVSALEKVTDFQSKIVGKSQRENPKSENEGDDKSWISTIAKARENLEKK